MAHGQAMITTPMNAVSASVSRGSGPQEPGDERQRPRRRARSGRRLDDPVGQPLDRRLRALRPLDEATIWASAVSRPDAGRAQDERARSCSGSPPMTSSPAPFATGIDSPVSIDSSTAESPSTTIPSTGTLLARPDAERGRPARRPRGRRPPRRRRGSGAPSSPGARRGGGSPRSSGPSPGPRASGPAGPGR